jgi:hypothetical protein
MRKKIKVLPYTMENNCWASARLSKYSPEPRLNVVEKTK